MRQGSPSLTSTTTVDVAVGDINDNHPRFTQLFRAAVHENAAPGTVVLQVTSIDADQTDDTRYSILHAADSDSSSSSPAALFAIDPATGAITVAGQIDRETAGDVVAVRVAANDGAFNAETTVTIDVVDEHDRPPACRLPPDPMQTVQTAAGAVVANVSAADDDATAPGFDAVVSLAAGGRWSRDFAVVDGGRAVAWRRAVPFQTTPGGRSSPLNARRVTLAAVDGGRPARSTECRSLSVRVLAENEFSPQFDRSSYSVAVPDNATAGFTVITLHAR